LPKIFVDIVSVKDTNLRLINTSANMENLKNDINRFGRNIDSRIQNLLGIGRRLNKLNNENMVIETKINNLLSGIDNYIEKYNSLENELIALAGEEKGNSRSVNRDLFIVGPTHNDRLIPLNFNILDFIRNTRMIGNVEWWKKIDSSFIEKIFGKVSDNKKPSSSIDKLSIFDAIMDHFSGSFGTIGKKYLLDSANLSLLSELFSYIKDTGDYFFNKGNEFDKFLSLISLGNASTGLFSEIYGWLKDGLSAVDSKAFSKKFGSLISGVDMFGSGFDFSKSTLEAYASLMKYLNPTKYGNASIWEVTGDMIAAVGKGVDFGGKSYIFYNFTPEALKLAKGAGGTTLSNVVPYLMLADMGFSTVSTAFKSYGKYSADGTVDMGDVSEIMIDSSFSGLGTVIPFFNDTTRDAVKNWAGNWGDKAASYITNNEALLDYYRQASGVEKTALTIASMAAVPGEYIVDSIGNGVRATGNAIKSGWSWATSFFKW